MGATSQSLSRWLFAVTFSLVSHSRGRFFVMRVGAFAYGLGQPGADRVFAQIETLVVVGVHLLGIFTTASRS